MIPNRFVNSYQDLVTTRSETRAGFISFAIEKNRRSTPFIESAKALKVFASQASSPMMLKDISEIRPQLVSASGLSDKSLSYLLDEDIDKAINELIANFLEPAGNEFIDELVYRFLLIQGDALGGKMRNLVGQIAQQKLVLALITTLNSFNITYKYLDSRSKGSQWFDGPDDIYGIELSLKALSWSFEGKSRVLAFNITVPTVRKNVDFCLFECSTTEFGQELFKSDNRYRMLGELKGGIDPAGADEHWKTANTAIQRIRSSFASKDLNPKTVFIGAAIENSMAEEIWNQLQIGYLSNAANLTKDNQLFDLCSWIIRQ